MSALFVLWRDRRASSAAEFALVLPLLLIFLLGIIDVGRLLWTYNRIEKTTQMGARFAIVTNPIPANLIYSSNSAIGLTDSSGHVLAAGDDLSNYAMGTATYTGTDDTGTNPKPAPTCAPTANCTVLGAITTASFDAIYNHMKIFLPELKRTNVEVKYSNSGLGYAGDPTGADFSPVVTVSVKGMNFHPISLALFKTDLSLGTIGAALTMEDGRGSQSN